MTRHTTLAALTLAALGTATASASLDEEDPATIYQLRTYATAPGKLDVLVERFARVNLPLFEEHGITLVGAWRPHEEDDQGDRLVYLVSFPSREAADSAWRAFGTDPEWTEAFGAEKAEHGQVVTKVETVYLLPTDYSPGPRSDEASGLTTGETDEEKNTRASQGEESRLFELRDYTASPGKLDALHARFRDHTMELFAKHGIANIVYTTPIEGETGAEEVLIYFVAHPSHVMALDSWESFRSDPAWIKARDESQADGVPLAAKVERAFLVPTEFSPLK